MKKLLRVVSAFSAAYAIKNWKGSGKCYALNLEPDDEIEDIMDLLFGIGKLDNDYDYIKYYNEIRKICARDDILYILLNGYMSLENFKIFVDERGISQNELPGLICYAIKNGRQDVAFFLSGKIVGNCYACGRKVIDA